MPLIEDPIVGGVSYISPSELERGLSTTCNLSTDEIGVSANVQLTEKDGIAPPRQSIGTNSRLLSRTNDVRRMSSPANPHLKNSALEQDHHNKRSPIASNLSLLFPLPVVPSQQDTIEPDTSDHLHLASPKIDQNTDMWLEYNNMADKEDREFVKTANENLNTLLIFAGIFAAINSSFILETFKSLKADPQDITNMLLRTQINLQNPNYSLHLPSSDDFHPATRDIRINLAFFSSLCTSLTGSFLAVIGKQWLSNYENEGSLKPPAERARERQRKFEGRERFHLQGVVESLPTLLQVALLVFLAGLADLLWPLERLSCGCVIIFLCGISIAWGSLTIIATFLPGFPYQTRLSIVLRRLIVPHQNREAPRTADESFAISIRIICQMLKNTIPSDTKRLIILADYLDTIPPNANIKELGDIMVQFHLTPLVVTATIPWDLLKNSMIHEEFRSSCMLRIVRCLVKNEKSLEPGVREAILSRIFLLSWQIELDDDCAQAVADIMASAVVQMEMMRAEVMKDSDWAPLLGRHQRRNLEIRIATRLCDIITEKGSQEANAYHLRHFFSCLPTIYSDDTAFTNILSRLAEFCESLPDGDADINTLGDLMMTFYLYRYLGEGKASQSGESPSNNEVFRSVPMLRIIDVLLLRYHMKHEDHRAVLFHIWRFSQRGEMKPDVAEAIAGIIAQNMGIHLASSLHASPVHEMRDEYVTACFNLLYHRFTGLYAADSAFLSSLADFYGSLPKDNVNINVLASATTKFFLYSQNYKKKTLAQAIGVKPSWPGRINLSEFQSVSMLRIIYTLIRHHMLESKALEKILSQVWYISQHECVKPEQADVIAKIIALEPKKVNELRRSAQSWSSILSPSQYHNMSVALVLQLVSVLEREQLDVEATWSWMSIFCEALDIKSLARADFLTILGTLADALTKVEEASIRLIMANQQKIWLEEVVAEENAFLQDAAELQVIPPQARDEICSIPMLVVIYVLLRCLAPNSEERKCILSRIWRESKRDVIEPGVAEMFAEIIILEALEVERLRLLYPSSSWVVVSPAQLRNLGTFLEQGLHDRLEDLSDEATNNARFGLLCDYLPESPSNSLSIISLQRYLTSSLATFYESLPPDDLGIKAMVRRLSRLYFDHFPPIKQSTSQPHFQSLPEIFLVNEVLRSIPLLRIILVLMKHHALPQGTQETILPYIWALSQENPVDNERAYLAEDIIIAQAFEVMQRLGSDQCPSFGPVQLSTLNDTLTSRLLNILVRRPSDLESTIHHATLLFRRLHGSLSEEIAAQVLKTQADFIVLLVESSTSETSLRPKLQLDPAALQFLNTPHLETEMVEPVLGLIWDISCQDVMQPNIIGLIVEIIASNATRIMTIRKIQSPSRFRGIASLDMVQYRNIGHQLASVLCELLVSGRLGEDDTASSLDLFWSCLPHEFTNDGVFVVMINRLAEFYNSLSINDTRVQSLVNSVIALITFADDAESQEGHQASPSLSSRYGELQSTPVIYIVTVLFQASFLKQAFMTTVSSHTKSTSWSDLLDQERAEIGSYAIALEQPRSAPTLTRRNARVYNKKRQLESTGLE